MLTWRNGSAIVRVGVENLLPRSLLPWCVRHSGCRPVLILLIFQPHYANIALPPTCIAAGSGSSIVQGRDLLY